MDNVIGEQLVEEENFGNVHYIRKKGISGCANNVNIYTETLDEVLKRIFNEMFINKEKIYREFIK